MVVALVVAVARDALQVLTRMVLAVAAVVVSLLEQVVQAGQIRQLHIGVLLAQVDRQVQQVVTTRLAKVLAVAVAGVPLAVLAAKALAVRAAQLSLAQLSQA
jgi:hypothetical protein